MTRPTLAIHGGAGAIRRSRITPQQQAEYEAALANTLRGGQRLLAAGATAVDVVAEAVRLLEECPLFNAGRGAVFTRAGTHELDASIMDGRTLACGAVAGVHTVRNPILAARAVTEDGRHVLLIGAGAEAFAREHGLELVAPDFFSTPQRHEQLLRVQRSGGATMVLDHDAAARAAGPRNAPLDEDGKLGTVGAVALDAHGSLAAATSTGGLTNKRPGRVGDSPIIGAGCYASNASCAVSATGTGEVFIRTVAAHSVAARMEYGGQSLQQAADDLVHRVLPPLNGAGGIIALDAQGNLAMPFNTEGMYRGWVVAGQSPRVAIYR